MPGLADLPPLSPRAGWLIAALIGVAWLALRVRILRLRDARRQPGEPPLPAWRWLRALADAPATNLVLAVLAAALLAAIGWVLTHGG